MDQPGPPATAAPELSAGGSAALQYSFDDMVLVAALLGHTGWVEIEWHPPTWEITDCACHGHLDMGGRLST